MIFGLDLAEDFFDLSFFIDQKGHAVISHVGSPHELFLAVGSVAFGNRTISVGQQTKRQVVLGGEFLMGFCVVE